MVLWAITAISSLHRTEKNWNKRWLFVKPMSHCTTNGIRYFVLRFWYGCRWGEDKYNTSNFDLYFIRLLCIFGGIVICSKSSGLRHKWLISWQRLSTDWFSLAEQGSFHSIGILVANLTTKNFIGVERTDTGQTKRSSDCPCSKHVVKIRLGADSIVKVVVLTTIGTITTAFVFFKSNSSLVERSGCQLKQLFSIILTK